MPNPNRDLPPPPEPQGQVPLPESPHEALPLQVRPPLVATGASKAVVSPAYVLGKWFTGNNKSSAADGAAASTYPSKVLAAVPESPRSARLREILVASPAGNIAPRLVKADRAASPSKDAAPELIVALEQCLDERWASWQLALQQQLEQLVTMQSTQFEGFVSDEMKIHRMWASDQFQRLNTSLQAVARRETPVTPRRRDLPPTAQACAPALSPSQPSAPGTQHPANVETDETKSEAAVSEAAFSEAAIEAHAIQETGEAWFGTRMSVRTRSQSQATDPQSAVIGLSVERDKMQRHLKRMKDTETRTSATGQMMAKAGVAGRHVEAHHHRVKKWRSEPPNLLGRLVGSHYFSMACMSAILANSAWIGIQTDIGIKDKLKHPPEDVPLWFEDINRCFLAFFVIELLLRLAAWRLAFFFRRDWQWNVFDLFIIISSIVEEIAVFYNFKFLRVMRLLRMARVVRVIRVVRFFVGLRQMLMSVVGCIWVLGWASCFMVFLSYLFAMLFLQGFLTYQHSDDETMRKYFGSVIWTMYTLLLAISNGLPWDLIADELAKVWPPFRLLLATYIIFVMFGVLNVVTGVFVERTAMLKDQDRDLAIHNELAATQSFVEELKSLFEEKGITEVQHMTFEVLHEVLQFTDVQMYMQTHGIDIAETYELFLLLDHNDSGTIGLDDFVYGCQRLKGAAKGFDIVLLHEYVVTLKDKLLELKIHADASSRTVRNSLDSFLQELRTMRADIAMIANDTADIKSDNAVSALSTGPAASVRMRHVY